MHNNFKILWKMIKIWTPLFLLTWTTYTGSGVTTSGVGILPCNDQQWGMWQKNCTWGPMGGGFLSTEWRNGWRGGEPSQIPWKRVRTWDTWLRSTWKEAESHRETILWSSVCDWICIRQLYLYLCRLLFSICRRRWEPCHCCGAPGRSLHCPHSLYYPYWHHYHREDIKDLLSGLNQAEFCRNSYEADTQMYLYFTLQDKRIAITCPGT